MARNKLAIELFEKYREEALSNLNSVPLVALLRNPRIIPSTAGIYIMYNVEKSKPYVGESVNVSRRLIQHATVKWPKQYIDREIQKLGPDKFRVAYLQTSTDFKERRKLEAKFVDLFNAYFYGYNGSIDGHPTTKFHRWAKKHYRKFMTKYLNSFNKNRKKSKKYQGWFKLMRYSKHLKRVNKKRKKAR